VEARRERSSGRDLSVAETRLPGVLAGDCGDAVRVGSGLHRLDAVFAAADTGAPRDSGAALFPRGAGRRGRGPFWLAVVAAAAVVVGKSLVDATPMTYAGVGLLIVAAVRNARTRRPTRTSVMRALRQTPTRANLKGVETLMAKTIEIFSAGCPTCDNTIELVKRLAGAEHRVHVHDMHHADTAARAKTLGIRSLPAVLINGTVAECCAGRGPDEHVLREALR
jgi:glutaredoxin